MAFICSHKSAAGPVNLIVSKSPVDIAGRHITVGDADGNLLCQSRPLLRPRSAAFPHQSYRVLIDAAEKPLVTLIRSPLLVLATRFMPIGSRFQRYCTISKGDSIMAQTTAFYKLGKVVVGRRRFRLTIYSRRDQILIIALLVVFFDGVY